ncbi:hypothetical protein FA95DRAFT_374061 [Auriscalpium vulgare]|uniref:Uncharacterized protein n=1 Tax=Auriscalpium vulgare TaxID=40419 RepID=A0ACB8RHY3_9AGAM|nr:hypothetical protein FA95DRAFT_374061 [Auriscalpium vulgare]
MARRPSSDVQSAGSRDSFIDLHSPDSPEFGHDSRVARSPSPADDSEDSTLPLFPAPPASVPRRSQIRINTSFAPNNSPKPPLPNTPKPKFRRSISAQPSPSADQARADPAPRLPPTTNHLAPQTRADLVRRSRKLAKVFGETPSPLSVSPRQRDPPASAHRSSPSFAGDDEAPGAAPASRWASPMSALGGRRFSAPWTRVGIEEAQWDSLTRTRGAGWRGRRRRESGGTEAGSFIDLSDDDTDDRVEARHAPPTARRSPSASSLNSPASSLHDSLDQHRRNREKLAKLHRFLGSRVPPGLVLGFTDSEPSLPPPMAPDAQADRPRLRRRSSSAAELKSTWYDDLDRVKEDLDEREKAINVRRAVKMEKMFGVQPPQTLYHTRHSPIPSSSPITFEPVRVSSLERDPSSPGGLPSSPTGRNMNQTAYINKKGRPVSSNSKAHRLSSRSSRSESSQNLLLDHESSGSSQTSTSPLVFSPANRTSAIYQHYRHSLNSLNDIMDRDDRESLAELHQFITNELPDVDESSPTTPQPPFEADARSIRAERRRSLPTRSSTLSLASQFQLGSADAEMVLFQRRRRRAAKLTNFFGVDYRDLFGDILESIEHGVQEDGHKGSLHPEEVQDLLQKLRNLRTKRTGAL